MLQTYQEFLLKYLIPKVSNLKIYLVTCQYVTKYIMYALISQCSVRIAQYAHYTHTTPMRWL